MVSAMRSIRQRKGDLTRQLRARRRWQTVRDLSAEGVSFRVACDKSGLTPGGLRTLLYRETGSSVWPID